MRSAPCSAHPHPVVPSAPPSSSFLCRDTNRSLLCSGQMLTSRSSSTLGWISRGGTSSRRTSGGTPGATKAAKSSSTRTRIARGVSALTRCARGLWGAGLSRFSVRIFKSRIVHERTPVVYRHISCDRPSGQGSPTLVLLVLSLRRFSSCFSPPVSLSFY